MAACTFRLPVVWVCCVFVVGWLLCCGSGSWPRKGVGQQWTWSRWLMKNTSWGREIPAS